MRSTVTVTPAQLPEVLLHVAVVRPVFLWGAPGIGKSSLVRKFATELGLECVTLLGTQLAPEDLIGVPELVGGRSRFAPPESIARHDPYCLFLDELNASSPEVQKAFYSLILDRRIGSYELPKGSIVIGAGNRAADNALARPMASALVNRMVHVYQSLPVPRRRRYPFSHERGQPVAIRSINQEARESREVYERESRAVGDWTVSAAAHRHRERAASRKQRTRPASNRTGRACDSGPLVDNCASSRRFRPVPQVHPFVVTPFVVSQNEGASASLLAPSSTC
jgi:MoxR-like ATPase